MSLAAESRNNRDADLMIRLIMIAAILLISAFFWLMFMLHMSKVPWE